MAVPTGRARKKLDQTGQVDLMDFIGEDSLEPEEYSNLLVVCLPSMKPGDTVLSSMARAALLQIFCYSAPNLVGMKLMQV